MKVYITGNAIDFMLELVSAVLLAIWSVIVAAIVIGNGTRNSYRKKQSGDITDEFHKIMEEIDEKQAGKKPVDTFDYTRKTFYKSEPSTPAERELSDIHNTIEEKNNGKKKQYR